MGRIGIRRATVWAVGLALLLAACGTDDGGVEARKAAPAPQFAPPPPAPDPTATATNVYAAASAPTLSPSLVGVPARVYVPNSGANTVDVIDPATFKVVDRFPVGATPHHVAPSWDMSKLYVDNTDGNSLTVIDPRTGRPTGTIPVTDPYNLYFTVDGKKAIVVAERFRRLDFRDPNSWQLIKTVPIPWPGVDHLDFSADGRYLIATTEFSGMVVKVDTERMEVTGTVSVGSQPIDVKLSPDGTVFYVTNQGRHGVSVIDPEAMREIEFIPTGRGAHGLVMSRDAKAMYVSNRLAGSITMIDMATRKVVGTSRMGGSPDMLQISPDGRQLWASHRYHAAVTVVDAQTGELLHVIKVGKGAHGLTYFPQPGRFSVGHNGVYR